MPICVPLSVDLLLNWPLVNLVTYMNHLSGKLIEVQHLFTNGPERSLHRSIHQLVLDLQGSIQDLPILILHPASTTPNPYPALAGVPFLWAHSLYSHIFLLNISTADISGKLDFCLARTFALSIIPNALKWTEASSSAPFQLTLSLASSIKILPHQHLELLLQHHLILLAISSCSCK